MAKVAMNDFIKDLSKEEVKAAFKCVRASEGHFEAIPEKSDIMIKLAIHFCINGPKGLAAEIDVMNGEIVEKHTVRSCFKIGPLNTKYGIQQLGRVSPFSWRKFCLLMALKLHTCGITGQFANSFVGEGMNYPISFTNEAFKKDMKDRILKGNVGEANLSLFTCFLIDAEIDEKMKKYASKKKQDH